MGNFPVDKLSANEVLIGGKKAVVTPPSDGNSYVMQNGVWIQADLATGGGGEVETPQGTSIIPNLSGALSANEASTVTITIDNFNALSIYSITVSGGGILRTNGAIQWTLPQVETITSHSMTVNVIDPGESQSYASHALSVLNVATSNDAILTYENATIAEFTNLRKMYIDNDKLIASGNTQLSVDTNQISSPLGMAEVGDAIEVAESQYRIDTTLDQLGFTADVMGDGSSTATLDFETGTADTLASATVNINGVHSVEGNELVMMDTATGVQVSGVTVKSAYFEMFHSSTDPLGLSYLVDAQSAGAGYCYLDSNNVVMGGMKVFIDGVELVSGALHGIPYDQWVTVYYESLTVPNTGITHFMGSSHAFQGRMRNFKAFDRNLLLEERAWLAAGGGVTTITGTTPTLPALINSAALISKQAISNVIDQDAIDTDFSGINDIATNFTFKNIAHKNSAIGTLVTTDYILSGDVVGVGFGDSNIDVTVSTITTGATVPSSFDKATLQGSKTGLIDDARGIAYSADGSKVIISSYYSQGTRQFSLSTPFDLSTAVYDDIMMWPSTYTLNISFSRDGLHMLKTDYFATVHHYKLSTPFGISTAVLSESSGATPQVAGRRYNASSFNDDGSLWYVSIYGLGIYQYTLTTPYDVTTWQYNDKVKSFNADPIGFCWNNNGSRLLITTSNGTPQVFTVTVPWDITTTVFEGTISGGIYGGAVTLSPDGRYIATGYATNGVYWSDFGSGESLNAQKTYEIDISLQNNTDLPILAYKKDLDVFFDFGNGYLKAENRLDTVLTTYVTGDNLSTTPATPDMTSDIAPSGIASASSVYQGTYPAWKAFDRSTLNSSSWLSVGVSGWLQYEFPEALTIDKHIVTFSMFSAVTEAPKSWDFEGSHDGVTWDTLQSVIDQTAWTSGESRAFACDNSTKYKYYRIYVYTNNGYTGYSVITELALVKADIPKEVNVTASYSNVLDGTGGRTLQTKVKSHNFGDTVSKIEGTIQKLV